ncbi:MAG: transposase [Lachnospiraceae bacterium]|nr:transposase [Lachnospiraceae bacterium]
MGKRKMADQWKSHMFNKYQDMVLIKGEDRTGEIQFMSFDKKYHQHVVYFVNGDIGYYELNDIKKLKDPMRRNVENKNVYIGETKIKDISFLLDFGNSKRIIYKNGDYQTEDFRSLEEVDKYNKIDKKAFKPYLYHLNPDKIQKEIIDNKIDKSREKEKSGEKVYLYNPDKLIGNIIKYKGKVAYADILDVGDVEIKMSDYPTGNCHEIHVKKTSNVYQITFYCYKRVVGIDLGKREIICSSGKRYNLPYINLKNTKKFWEIKKAWEESVVMQLLLEYDILFLEYLERNNKTDPGFEDMIGFPNILKDKAKLFNQGNPQNAYEKEVYILESKYPSTQICHICGYQNEDLAVNLQKRNWMCPYCGTKHDRDINAAINILRHGMEEKILNNKMEEN